jgi:hypothetical protein
MDGDCVMTEAQALIEIAKAINELANVLGTMCFIMVFFLLFKKMG